MERHFEVNSYRICTTVQQSEGRPMHLDSEIVLILKEASTASEAFVRLCELKKARGPLKKSADSKGAAQALRPPALSSRSVILS
jgi:hypothetical protein